MTTKSVVACVEDLFFRSKIDATARHLDVAVELPQVLGVDLVLKAAQLVRVLVRPVRGEVFVLLDDRALRRHRLLDQGG